MLIYIVKRCHYMYRRISRSACYSYSAGISRVYSRTRSGLLTRSKVFERRIRFSLSSILLKMA